MINNDEDDDYNHNDDDADYAVDNDNDDNDDDEDDDDDDDDVLTGLAYMAALCSYRGSLNPARALGPAFVANRFLLKIFTLMIMIMMRRRSIGVWHLLLIGFCSKF